MYLCALIIWGQHNSVPCSMDSKSKWPQWHLGILPLLQRPQNSAYRLLRQAPRTWGKRCRKRETVLFGFQISKLLWGTSVSVSMVGIGALFLRLPLGLSVLGNHQLVSMAEKWEKFLYIAHQGVQSKDHSLGPKKFYINVISCVLSHSGVSCSLWPCQAPPFVGLSRQEYWNGLLFP